MVYLETWIEWFIFHSDWTENMIFIDFDLTENCCVVVLKMLPVELHITTSKRDFY